MYETFIFIMAKLLCCTAELYTCITSTPQLTQNNHTKIPQVSHNTHTALRSGLRLRCKIEKLRAERCKINLNCSVPFDFDCKYYPTVPGTRVLVPTFFFSVAGELTTR